MKKIFIGADHAGFRLKEKLRVYLEKKGYPVKDFGAYSAHRCDYPDIAYQVAKGISQGKSNKGILICKTGIGNSIVANRLPRVRAALCYNAKAARLSREHNDSNILVLGACFVNESAAKRIIDVWLKTKFQGGRHQRRLNKIREIENIMQHQVNKGCIDYSDSK